MSKLLIAAAAGLTAAAVAAVPAQAQTAGSGQMEVIVYGDDPCPREAEDEVVVCRKLPESERYRLPENYRPSGPRQAGQAWANKARQLEQVSRVGIGSCSAVGPGGHTGCTLEEIQRNEEAVREEIEQTTAPEQ